MTCPLTSCSVCSSINGSLRLQWWSIQYQSIVLVLLFWQSRIRQNNLRCRTGPMYIHGHVIHCTWTLGNLDCVLGWVTNLVWTVPLFPYVQWVMNSVFFQRWNGDGVNVNLTVFYLNFAGKIPYMSANSLRLQPQFLERIRKKKLSLGSPKPVAFFVLGSWRLTVCWLH